MANSLRAKLSKLRHDGRITDEEYHEFIEKLDGHDRVLLKECVVLTKEAYSDLCLRAAKATVTDINVGGLISRQAAKSKAVYSTERHEKVVPVAELDWLPSVESEKCGDCISRQAVIHGLDNIEIKRNGTWYELYQKAINMINDLPSVTPGRSDNPERNRPESIKYCENCDHVEMCSWYPTDGCEWLNRGMYERGYNNAKREIALSGEYERAYQRGFEDGRKSEWTAVAETEVKHEAKD